MYKILSFNRLKYLSYFIYFFLLNFGGRYAINGIAFFILIALIGFGAEGFGKRNHFNKLFILPILFYIFHVISAFLFSEHKPEAFFDLEVKLSFLLLPLIFGFQKNNSKEDIRILLLLYSGSSMVAGIILLMRAFIMYFMNGKLPIYSSFSPDLHVTYLSAYMTVNLAVSAFLLKSGLLKMEKLIVIISLVTTLPIIIFAQSKAGILIYLFVFIILVFKYLYQINKKISTLSLAIILILAGMILWTNPRFKAMIRSASHYKNYIGGSKKNVESTAERIMTWSASIKLIEENFITGIGNGDARIELKNKYEELGYSEPARLNLNAHNQYLDTTLFIGIFGLLILLSIFMIPILFKNFSKNILLRIFLTIFSLHFLFESMLNTQAGVVYFMFFFAFFIKNNEILEDFTLQNGGIHKTKAN